MNWTALCCLDDIVVTRARHVEVLGKALAVVRTGEDRVMVCDEACPHAGASLSGGEVVPIGTISPDAACLVCPMHHWPFRITDGVCPDAPCYRVRMYPAKIDPVTRMVYAALECPSFN